MFFLSHTFNCFVKSLPYSSFWLQSFPRISNNDIVGCLYIFSVFLAMAQLLFTTLTRTGSLGSSFTLRVCQAPLSTITSQLVAGKWSTPWFDELIDLPQLGRVGRPHCTILVNARRAQNGQEAVVVALLLGMAQSLLSLNIAGTNSEEQSMCVTTASLPWPTVRERGLPWEF